jgi:hypothetical protein
LLQPIASTPPPLPAVKSQKCRERTLTNLGCGTYHQITAPVGDGVGTFLFDVRMKLASFAPGITDPGRGISPKRKPAHAAVPVSARKNPSRRSAWRQPQSQTRAARIG